MGRLISGTPPQLRLHKASGQGYVRLAGKVVYVGRYGTPAANARYFELMAEHGYAPAIAAQPAKPVAPDPVRLPAGDQPIPAHLSLGEVCAMYLADMEAKSTPGRRCSKHEKALAAVRAVRPLATMPAADFGTRALIDVRNRLIATPVRSTRPGKHDKKPTLSRRYVNEVIRHVQRMMAWAALQELLPAERAAALTVVKPLRKGEDETVRETRPRKPVAVSVVRATLPYMTKEMADLVWFIRLTGCRPSEAARMRWCRIFDRHKTVWRYVPRKHKTAYKGRSLHIAIGPQAQKIVTAHAAGRGPREFVFTPQRSVRAKKPRSGIVPMESWRPASHSRKCFTKDGICQAIRRAVIRANKARREEGLPLLPHWFPYQLRYLRLREIRRDQGPEAARATAGHARESMTAHYAPPSFKAAARAAMAAG